MGIPPLHAPNPLGVMHAHIHASQIANPAVNDHQFAVIAVIQGPSPRPDPLNLPPASFNSRKSGLTKVNPHPKLS